MVRKLHTPLLTCVAMAVCGVAGALTSTAAAATTFSFTGGEQTYTVPTSVHALFVTATGAAGGGPTAIDPAWGFFIPGGRAAAVSGFIAASPGQVLYVEVGGVGGKPDGGFNGGGTAGRVVFPGFELSSNGGGGATDLRMRPRGDPNSLPSRLVVAAGGGGSAHPAAGGGDAGQPGPGNPAAGAGGGAGTQSAGGAAGCDPGPVGCGTAGTLGTGGNGGTSSTGFLGAGGGGGLYGGGGGAGDPSGVGGGGGGSSAVPRHGTFTLAASHTTPSSATIQPACPRRLVGNSTGLSTVDISSNPSPTTTVSSGHLSHLGNFTSSGSGSFTPLAAPPVIPYTVTGTQTLVAANGDKLFGTVNGNGVAESESGSETGTNVVTITGGTGRFTDAVGTYQETYSGPTVFTSATSATTTLTTTISGQISYCGGQRHGHS